ncbi:MAG TPA: nucleoside triphosphate pyrophosphatase [Actinomycetes bacterium]|nr:nucleoside triphosphate pyrophosphatase [Actinomycetes bacterium]
MAGKRLATLMAATPPPLILASASPARLRVMRGAGLRPEVEVSGVDEADIGAETTAQTCLRLATAKAEAVAADRQEGIVIGCDSILDVNGERLGKPSSIEEARQRWREMAGRSGALLTGHCLIDVGTRIRAADVAATEVRFGTPTADELESYLTTDEPLQVAGAFTIDGLAGPFVDGVVGDPHNVLGLSLPLLRRLLADLGYRITDFWAQPPTRDA